MPLIRGARFLLAQTDHEVAVYRQFGARSGRVVIAPLPVDLGTFSPLPASGVFRSRHGIPGDRRLVLFLGRLHSSKGINFLIETFTVASAQSPNLHLAIIGNDCGYQAEIERLIAQRGIAHRVTLCGAMFDRERLTAYVDADLFAITPAVYEETSLASLEALACGVPVLTTERSSIPWLEQYEAGYIHGADDRDGIIGRLVQHAALPQPARDLMKARASQLIKEKFAASIAGRQLESLCREAVAHGL